MANRAVTTGDGQSAMRERSPLPIVVELDADERVTEAARRVALAEGERVILVIPWSRAWSEADFELIARRAAGLSRAVAVVLRDAQTRARARAAGLPAFASLGAAKRATWSRPKPRAATRRAGLLGRPPARPPVTARRVRRAPGVMRLLVAVLTLLAAGGLVALVVVALPSATVTVRPAQRAVEASFEAQARVGAKLDPAAGMIPARRLETVVEAKAEATPSGVREEPDRRASGFVTFVSRRPEAVSMALGTVVETSGGARVRFRTTQAASLPADVGATVRVPVVAVEPGAVGNVPAYAVNSVEAPLALTVGVVNDAPMAGGSTRQEAVVTEDDRGRLVADLAARLRTEASTGLRAQLAPGERLAGEGTEFAVVSQRFDTDMTLAGGPVSLLMRLRAVGVAYDPAAAGAVAAEALSRRLPPGYRLLTGDTRYTVSDAERIVPGEAGPSVVVGGQAQGRAVAVVDRPAVRSAVRGLPPAEAAAVVAAQTDLAEAPWVTVGPSWLARHWNRLPWLPMRIEVVVLGDGS